METGRGGVGYDQKRWNAEEKDRMVMEALTTSTETAEIYRKHGLSPNTFYPWREKFLEAGKSNAAVAKAFQRKNERLKTRLAESTLLHDMPVGMPHDVGVLTLKPDPLSTLCLCRARLHQPVFFQDIMYGAPAYVLVCQRLGDPPHSRTAASALGQH